MANVMRYKYGKTNPVLCPVDSATVIQIGDLVYQDTDDAKPAADTTWDTNLATTQENFHDLFLGVAMQQSRSGDTDSIRVATTGVFEFIAASDTYELGQLVGPDKDTGDALLSQTVEDVATANLAVGHIARREGTATTTVYVDIKSVVMSGGPQAAA